MAAIAQSGVVTLVVTTGKHVLHTQFHWLPSFLQTLDTYVVDNHAALCSTLHTRIKHVSIILLVAKSAHDPHCP